MKGFLILFVKWVLIDKASGLISPSKLFGVSLGTVVVLLVGFDGVAAIVRNSPPVIIPALKDYIIVIFSSIGAIAYGLGRDMGHTITLALSAMIPRG